MHAAGSMNFISYESAMSLYPSATLVHEHSYLLPMTPRSWQSAPSYPFRRTVDLTDCRCDLEVARSRIYTSKDAPDLRIGIERYMGDRWSWYINYDGNGKVIHNPASGGCDERVHDLSRSRWVTNLWRNIPKVVISSTENN